jgi:hypothetical protein
MDYSKEADDLTRESQFDSSAFLFGCEKGNKDLFHIFPIDAMSYYVVRY